MKVVESIWLQRLTYKLCPQVVFQFMKTFVEDILFGFIKKTMIMYMQPTLVNCLRATYTFDLWMSKEAHDVFDVIVNFISNH